jgi:hypothetical protein
MGVEFQSADLWRGRCARGYIVCLCHLATFLYRETDAVVQKMAPRKIAAVTTGCAIHTVMAVIRMGHSPPALSVSFAQLAGLVVQLQLATQQPRKSSPVLQCLSEIGTSCCNVRCRCSHQQDGCACFACACNCETWCNTGAPTFSFTLSPSNVLCALCPIGSYCPGKELRSGVCIA